MKADEDRARYVVGQLDDIGRRINLLVDQAEALIHTLDEMQRLVTRAEWAARRMPSNLPALPTPALPRTKKKRAAKSATR